MSTSQSRAEQTDIPLVPSEITEVEPEVSPEVQGVAAWAWWIKRVLSFVPFGLITVVALLVAYYYYSEASRLLTNSQATAQEEVAQIVTLVGELIVLPEEEQPTVATVTDPDRLRDQPFFAKAKVGDRVLIYTNARKAILYDPAAHKIVEVAPLNIGQ